MCFFHRRCKSRSLLCAFDCHCGLSQVAHLKDLVKESEENLDSAESHISCLKDSQEKLLIELDATRARVRETSNLLTDLQVKHSSFFALFITYNLHNKYCKSVILLEQTEACYRYKTLTLWERDACV